MKKERERERTKTDRKINNQPTMQVISSTLLRTHFATTNAFQVIINLEEYYPGFRDWVLQIPRLSRLGPPNKFFCP